MIYVHTNGHVGMTVFANKSGTMTPLQQFNLGTPSKYVQCEDGLQLIIKYTTGKPACVVLEHGKKLLMQGWASGIVMMSNSICDSNCKENLEAQGFVCYEAAKNSNFCTDKLSREISDIVIPYGANSPNGKNYVPDSIVVSMGINNTVRWTNVDSVPHAIVDNDGKFSSSLIMPNQTWTFRFNEIGEYGYHGEPGPWLHGVITVLPIDLNLEKGKPVENNGGNPYSGRYIFRENDSLGYIMQVSVLDDKSALISLSYPDKMKSEKISIGNEFIASCLESDNFTNVKTFVLEEINKEQKFVQFREEVILYNKNCNDLIP